MATAVIMNATAGVPLINSQKLALTTAAAMAAPAPAAPQGVALSRPPTGRWTTYYGRAGMSVSTATKQKRGNERDRKKVTSTALATEATMSATTAAKTKYLAG